MGYSCIEPYLAALKRTIWCSLETDKRTMTSEAPTAVRLIFGGGFTQIRFMADEFPPYSTIPHSFK